MKKLAFALALLLALTACGKAPAADTPAATTPPPAETPAPSPTPDAEEWWKGLDLTALPTRESGPVELSDGVTVTCMAQAKEADIALYAVLFPTRNTQDLLLRYVDKLQPAGVAFPGDQVSDFTFQDFDGDGESELCSVLRAGHTSTLTLYEWDEGWTAVPYDPADFSRELLDLLDVRESSSQVKVSYGKVTATYSPGPKDQGLSGLHRDFGDLAAFWPEDGRLYASFGLAADVGGELRYFGTMTASVTYDGAGFSLYDLQLLSNSGV